MTNSEPLDGLIFDMDGTLWNGVECYSQGFNDYFIEQGLERRLKSDDLNALMGLEEDKFLEVVLPEFAFVERKKAYRQIIMHQYRRVDLGHGLLYDGVRSGLEQLSKKFKIFIVSNCPEFMIRHFVEWARIEAMISDSMAHGENHLPKHRNISSLIEKHKLKNACYIGDTDSDRIQSERVPLPFVYVDYGFGSALKYDIKFSSFSDLTQYFLTKSSG